jgi:hypothetical protein
VWLLVGGLAAILVLVGVGALLTFFLATQARVQERASPPPVSGTMLSARTGHTATPLPGGKILVTGGFGAPAGRDGVEALASAEFFDPATGLSSAAPSMREARAGHTATRLANGKVLVVGGKAATPLASAELYVPASGSRAGEAGTGSWSPAGQMATARSEHTATFLPGGWVLIIGGVGRDGPLATAEIYDPERGAWMSGGRMSTPRYGHTATLLPDGKVLVVGGSAGRGPLASVEIFDMFTGAWLAAPNLVTAHSGHSATVLRGDRILVAGGATSAAELYDPVGGAWSRTGSLTTARGGHTAALLPDGRVLLGGGNGPDGKSLSSVELFDATAGAWTNGGSLIKSRGGHTMTLLSSGKLLFAGGAETRGAPDLQVLSAWEFFEAAAAR